MKLLAQYDKAELPGILYEVQLYWIMQHSALCNSINACVKKNAKDEMILRVKVLVTSLG